MAESPIGKYRKKPVEIEAMHYLGEFPLSFLHANEQVRSAREVRSARGLPGAVVIETVDGVASTSTVANIGDYIVRNNGEVYSLNPELFAALYEPAEEEK
jgi:hypothetical protein